MLDPVPTGLQILMAARASEKRSDKENNEIWAGIIRAYWQRKGFSNVTAQASYVVQRFKKDENDCRHECWIVATNLVNCLPPRHC